VEFFAPWCGHCKSLAPEWEKVANALKGVVGVGAVDADNHKSLAGEYSIQGFPTIKVFVDGKFLEDYQGARDAKAMVEYAMGQTKKLVSKRMGGGGGKESKGGKAGGKDGVVTLTQANFKTTVLDSDDYWLVEFFAPWCGHCKKLEPEWASAARQLAGRAKLGAVDATQEQALAQQYGVQGYPTIKEVIKGKIQDYQGGRTASDIVQYVEAKLLQYAKPLELVELTSPELMDASCLNKQICLLAVLPDILDTGAAGRREYLAVVEQVAAQYKVRPWGLMWTGAQLQSELERSLNMDGAGYPAFVALSLKKERFAKHAGTFTFESLKSFIDGMMSGETRTSDLGTVGKVVKVAPWDGKDGEIIEEEEFDLADLMNDEL